MVSHHSVVLLGISGSPRKASTAFVIREALAYAAKKSKAKTDYFSLQGKGINFCVHCDYCIRERKGCIQKDSMTEAYEKMEEAEAFIIGTPVYNGSVSGQLKTFFDRCRGMVAKNPDALKNKVGAGVAVGGDRLGGQELALLTIHSFYQANKMIPVGGGPFGANLGGAVWSRDLGEEGARKDAEGLRTVYKTVDRLVEVAIRLKESSNRT
ncbi:MAG: flavodoxin family protein [Candidatus Bathyarchaeota archaeon]|nr:MAG: flavodoxin family protein [Candidatus Bathyarchaeota archaeon]